MLTARVLVGIQCWGRQVMFRTETWKKPSTLTVWKALCPLSHRGGNEYSLRALEAEKVRPRSCCCFILFPKCSGSGELSWVDQSPLFLCEASLQTDDWKHTLGSNLSSHAAGIIPAKSIIGLPLYHRLWKLLFPWMCILDASSDFFFVK